MAISKQRKQEVVDDIANLLSTSKMTVIAKYQGTSVKAMQDFRRQAKAKGTTVKIAKNRLVKQALLKNDILAKTDTNILEGMLLYAFNSDDEVASAQVIAEFNKADHHFDFVGAISVSGQLLTADEVSELALLPSKENLIAQVLATLASPINDISRALSGNLSTILESLTVAAKN